MSPALNRGPFARASFIACAAFGALVIFAAPAQASQVSKAPCWETLLNEWYGGSITTVFPISCYHQAISHLPLDAQEYSNARNDIEAALAQAVAREEHQPVTTTIGGTTTTFQPTPPPKTTTTKKKRSPVSSAIRDITPGGPGSFPLPLLILGLLAILLVLAGLGGLGWRRYQSRRGTA